MIQYNPDKALVSITTPQQGFGYKMVKDKTNTDITNKAIKAYIEKINKSMQGKFISGDTLTDTLLEEEIIDMVNMAGEKLGLPLTEQLEITSDEIRQIVKAETEKVRAKKQAATSTAQNPQGKQQKFKNFISEEEYPEFCRKRTMEINKKMDEFWRGLKYDRKNDIQQEIVERFGEGQSIMLMGDTGIGKTFNPEYIAKENGISAMTVKLHRASDSVELLGKTSFRANDLTGEQEMFYDYGFLANAFKQTAKDSRENRKGFVLILDEILRAEDMTPFISNLSVNGNDEYVLSIDESNTFARIVTDQGEVWFHVSDDIDREKQTYNIDASGRVVLNNDTQPLYKFDGSAEQAAERHFRGDLLSIYRDDYRTIIQKNRNSILVTHKEKTKIYTPARAISIVGTTNIGENYEVNMMTDNALVSRLNPILTTAPKISYMVDKTIQKIAETKRWTPAEQKQLKKVITNFATALSKVFKNNKSIENPQKINFRILSDIVGGIAPERPFADGKWNVENVMKRSAIKFLSIDSSLTADEIKKDPIIDAVVRGAEKAIELAENPAFKGVKEDSVEQSAPLVEEDDGMDGVDGSGGMKL